MISKWKLELLAFLTSLTLISVGFSSWQITTGPTLLNGTIQASPVQQASQYITFDETANDTNGTGVKMFEYKDTLGFVNPQKPNGPYTTGSITLNYQINVDNCRGYNAFDSFIMRDDDLDEAELEYLQLNVTINLRDTATGNYNFNALNQFLTYAPINVSTSTYCSGVYYNGTTNSSQSLTIGSNTNNFFAEVIENNVIAFLFPISKGTDDGANDILDKIALTFSFVAQSDANAKAAAALLEGKEFSFQTAFKGRPNNDFSYN